jgi:hypothetical protein
MSKPRVQGQCNDMGEVKGFPDMKNSIGRDKNER